jgi:hypothetical protein
VEAVSISAEQLAQATTWRGIKIDEIPKIANAKYPKGAYETISADAGAAVAGKTDIKFPYVG